VKSILNIPRKVPQINKAIDIYR